VSNIQPAGQNRPGAWLNSARGMILQSKKLLYLLEVYSVTLQQLVTRFHLLETLTQLPVFYWCFSVFLTWEYPVFCIFLFACSHPFEFSNRYEYAKVQLLL